MRYVRTNLALRQGPGLALRFVYASLGEYRAEWQNELLLLERGKASSNMLTAGAAAPAVMEATSPRSGPVIAALRGPSNVLVSVETYFFHAGG